MKSGTEERRRFFTGELPPALKNHSGSFFGAMVNGNNIRFGFLGVAGAVFQAIVLYSMRDIPVMRDPLMRWFTLAAIIGLLFFGLFFFRQTHGNLSASSLWACQAAFVVYYIAVDLCILYLSHQMQQAAVQWVPVLLLGALAVLPAWLGAAAFLCYFLSIILFAGAPIYGLFAVAFAYVLSREQYRQLLIRFSLTVKTDEMTQSQADMAKRLDRMTAWDDQTQMNNRRAMSSWLEAVWPLCVRNHIPVAVIMLTPDGISDVRNEKGPQKALNRLSQFAAALKPFVRRQSDFLGRYEEDKFIILYSGPSREDTDMLIQRIRSELDKQVWQDHAEEAISLCTGAIYGLPKDNMVAAQWMTRADDVLEKAKAKGPGYSIVENA